MTVKAAKNMLLNDTHQLNEYCRPISNVSIFIQQLLSKYGKTETSATSAASVHKWNEEKYHDTRKGNCGLRYLKSNYK